MALKREQFKASNIGYVADERKKNEAEKNVFGCAMITAAGVCSKTRREIVLSEDLGQEWPTPNNCEQR